MLSAVAEEMLYLAGAAAYKRRARSPSPEQLRRDSPRQYWRWQLQTSARLFSHYEGLDVRGRVVVDVGCGLGGRSVYLAMQRPRYLLATDINAQEVACARSLLEELAPELRGRLEFTTLPLEALPSESFDLVVVVDAMEHVRKPVAFLRHCRRVVRPGGRVYFGTIGWFSPWAAHVGGVLPLPWLTVLFPDRVILAALRRILRSGFYRPSQWDSDPPVARWIGIEDLRDRPGEYLNKLTVAGFERLLELAGFSRWRLKVVGFSHPLARALNFLCQVPGLREMWHSYLVGIGWR